MQRKSRADAFRLALAFFLDRLLCGCEQLLRLMSKEVILTASLAGAVALTVTAQTPAPGTGSPPATNTPLELRVTAVNGSEIDLSKLRGKVVLIDFWATRCPPCVEAVPKVLATYNTFHEKGLEIIGISTDESKEILISFIKARGIHWPQYLDENRKLSSRWQIPGLPDIWLINKKGFLVNVSAQDDLQGNVEKVLAEE